MYTQAWRTKLNFPYNMNTTREMPEPRGGGGGGVGGILQKWELTILLNFSMVVSGIVPSAMIFLVPSLLEKKRKNIRKKWRQWRTTYKIYKHTHIYLYINTYTHLHGHTHNCINTSMHIHNTHAYIWRCLYRYVCGVYSILIDVISILSFCRPHGLIRVLS